ncbi:MAG: autotransporter-associated beta strand repeat-containing protein [Planctomycetaceae bacterium]|nr:autotransporter-associated beta strand repeat-containing protein [Planctomycetaceae bacterium]
MKWTLMTALAVVAIAGFVPAASAADYYLRSGTASLTGSGTWEYYNGSSWVSGTFTPSAGNNYFVDSGATISGAGTFAGSSLQINAGGKLSMTGSAVVTALTLNGGTLAGYASAASTFTGTVTLTGSSFIEGGNYLVLAPATMIQGNSAYSLTYASGKIDIQSNYGGNGWIDENEAVVYSGDTIISAGATVTGFRYRVTTFGSQKGDLTVDGTLDMGLNVYAKDQNINGLYGSGTITGNATGRDGAPGLTVGYGDADGNFSGNIIATAGQTGKLGLTKIGSGTQILSGTNTYTGATTVTLGALLINGDSSGAVGVVTVNSGATLGGSGIIGGATTILSGGKLSPGASAGTLTIDDSLNISGALGGAAGSLLFDLGDMVTLTGTNVLTIGSGLLNWDDFVFTGTVTGPRTYTLFDTGAAISGTLGTNLSGKIGSFDGTLSMSESGQDILLTVIPEPATMSLLVLGGLAALIRRRR